MSSLYRRPLAAPWRSWHNEQMGERVALYMRVSTDEQRERSSIDTQESFLRQYADLYELTVAEVYRDEAVSGTVPLEERPEGHRMLRDAAAEEFSSVAVYRLDRIGRSLLVVVDAHDTLEALGMSLRSATEPVETSTPSGRLIFQMLASFAEFERGTIRERTRAGMMRALAAGKQPGRIPYGYVVDEDGMMRIHEGEAEVVREVIENVAAGATLYSEMDRLNASGVPAPGTRYRGQERKAGKSWSHTTVSNIVHQSAYSGTHRVAGGIERPVPAIVTLELQRAAEAKLAEKKGRYNRKEDRKYLLRGLVRCGVCGNACTGHPTASKGRRLYYYVCTDGRVGREPKGPEKHAPYINAEKLEAAVWSDVKSFLRSPGELVERLEAERRGPSLVEDPKAKYEKLRREIREASATKDRYVRLYATGRLTDEELDGYLSETKVRLETLGELAASVQADISEAHKTTEIAATAEAWLVSLSRRLKEAEESFEVRRALVEALVEEVVVGGKREGEKPEVTARYRFCEPQGFVARVRNSCESGKSTTNSEPPPGAKLAVNL